MTNKLEQQLKKVIDKNVKLSAENKRLKMIKLPKFSADDKRYVAQWAGIKPVDQIANELHRSKGQVIEECERQELDWEIE